MHEPEMFHVKLNNIKANKVTILGGGQWGRTIGLLLSQKDSEILIWDKRDNLQGELSQFYQSMRIMGHEIRREPAFETDLSQSIKNAGIIFITLPSGAVREVARMIKRLNYNSCPIVVASKGMDEFEGEYYLLSDALCAEIGNGCRWGVLSGPNLSKEIQAKHPAVTIIASQSEELIGMVMSLLASSKFRIYGSHDVIGVQIGGAVKNVIALAGGMVDELGFEYNTKSALLTRGLAEITRLGTKMGGSRETFAGISGLGDLICTAFSPTSRNYRAGRMFGRGLHREEVEKSIGEIIEGINNARIVNQLAQRQNVEMPISHGVNRVIWEEVNPIRVIEELMTRELKFE